MKHTRVALAMIASIPISASASGWTYSESRLSYLNQNSTSDTKRRANLNLGFEAGRNQLGCATFSEPPRTTQVRWKRTSLLDRI